MFRASHAGPVDLLALHRAAPQEFPFLPQSVAPDPKNRGANRYDILFAFPEDALTQEAGGDFFQALSTAARAAAAEPGGLPFVGGWFVLLSYELAGRIE